MDMLPTAQKWAVGKEKTSTAAEPLTGTQKEKNVAACYSKTIVIQLEKRLQY
jgi:hypothetical protein